MNWWCKICTFLSWHLATLSFMIILVVCQRRLWFTLALSIDSCHKTTVSCSIPCLSQGISLIKVHHRIGYVGWSTWTSLRAWGRRETLGGGVRWRRGDLNFYVLGPGVRRQSRRCGGATVAHNTTDWEQAWSPMQLDSDLLGYIDSFLDQINDLC